MVKKTVGKGYFDLYKLFSKEGVASLKELIEQDHGKPEIPETDKQLEHSVHLEQGEQQIGSQKHAVHMKPGKKQQQHGQGF